MQGYHCRIQAYCMVEVREDFNPRILTVSPLYGGSAEGIFFYVHGEGI